MRIKVSFMQIEFLKIFITLPTHIGFSHTDIKKISKEINLYQNNQLKKLV